MIGKFLERLFGKCARCSANRRQKKEPVIVERRQPVISHSAASKQQYDAIDRFAAAVQKARKA